MAFAYVAGNIMTYGNQCELARVEEILTEAGVDFYSPRLNKSINDKKAVTVEANNGLAERIVKADTDRIRQADIIVVIVDQGGIGTLVEIGQIFEMVSRGDKKRVFFTCSDIRRTDLPEQGDRRSFSLNQYLYGVILALTDGKGIQELDEIKEELKAIVEAENA
ncbi:nucleoside 2-deoxyribosyltransferase [Boudabousia marimammalium]|uniref:Nucleoside 2-deoxyribosyltransferase n=1 Tax=Boudabousia marimammalium TaxID=156892 RepID=A0A1Q5PKG0_9ACTO|nr:nucleoside 2-deoxyribosyltransferase [Boudabousia marimammalium]OKL46704.1 hypothetical protein BM477_07055 [Boudabousia marimammalium]